MKGLLRLLLCLAFGATACSEGFGIGELDGGFGDGGVYDASVGDGGVPRHGEDDASIPDAAPFDAAPVDASGSEGDPCSPPWLVTLVRDEETQDVDLWRFSLAAEEARRCMPAQPFRLPAGARDAEMVDDATAIVAGLEGVTLVDLLSGETLDTFPAPEGDFTEVQTLAFGSSTRVGAVAWGSGEGDGRLNTVRHLEAYPLGAAATPLPLPEEGFCRRPMRMSSYQGDQAAALFLSCDEVYSFSPTTGVRDEDPALPQEVGGYVFHTLPDGRSAGADTTDVVLWRPGQPRRRVLNPCPQRELEAAPDPSNFEAAFFRCEDDLMHYDFAAESRSTLIGESIEHLGLQVLSLGVAVDFSRS